MKKFKPPIFLTFLIIAIVVVVWLGTGIYTLKSGGGEQGVILRFGQYIRTDTEAGLKWHLPAPIETLEIVQADVVRSLEIGYRTVQAGNQTQASTFQVVPEESLMITGDENLVNTETVIQYRINDVKKFLFSVDDPMGTLKIISESAIRRVVANHKLDDVLTDQKEIVQMEIRDDLQNICKEYNLGFEITKVALQSVSAPTEVQDAFNDVIKAREDKSRFINEAKKQANEIVPAAEALQQEMLNEANAYKEKRMAESRGDVENFKQVYEKYKLGPEVTMARLYLETMEQVLPQAKIYFMKDAGETLKYMNVDGADSSGTTPKPYTNPSTVAPVTPVTPVTPVAP